MDPQSVKNHRQQQIQVYHSTQPIHVGIFFHQPKIAHSKDRLGPSNGLYSTGVFRSSKELVGS